jgi:adenosylmethionine-8-amino-7-oxononanoate aminotransferase
MTGGFTHGFTYSHHGVAAAAGRAVLAVLKQLDLVQAARDRGAQLDAALRGELGNHGRRHPWSGAAARDRAGV